MLYLVSSHTSVDHCFTLAVPKSISHEGARLRAGHSCVAACLMLFAAVCLVDARPAKPTLRMRANATLVFVLLRV
eukprot:7535769-Alexandrium_andersonii.AAC.1